MTNTILVIVPCGTAKIWKRNSLAGPTAARDAYTGAPFKVNREFAEKHADAWVILSAKYGFMDPTFVIPEPYEVTFKNAATRPIDYVTLKYQVRDKRLSEFERVIGLGGKDYRAAIESAFRDENVRLEFPTAGLKIGEAMSFVKHYDPHQE